MKFQCRSGFLPQYLLLFNPESALCLLFFSQLLMAYNDRCSHKLLQRNSPSISFQPKCIWLNMTGYTSGFGCRYMYSNLDHVSDMAFCLYFQLWPLFSQVFDRLGRQVHVSEQKTREHWIRSKSWYIAWSWLIFPYFMISDIVCTDLSLQYTVLQYTYCYFCWKCTDLS